MPLLVVDLATLGSGSGFAILGEAAGDQLGRSVAGVGDVNGDGIDDVIIGAPFGDEGGLNAGTTYVVYGKAGSRGEVDLTNLAALDGFLVRGDTANDLVGYSVAGAGDVNGDGIGDLIIGGPAIYEGDSGGQAYVIYGRDGASRGALDLTRLAPADGFVLRGDAASEYVGYRVASAGDVNGDGIDDLIVGVPKGSDGGAFAGEAYVVFGRSAATRPGVTLGNLAPADGFVVQGDTEFDGLGRSVAAAGDVNGDGIDDVIIGAPYFEDPLTGLFTGAAYVIYGRTGEIRSRIDLSSLAASDGFLLLGGANSETGLSVAAAGDANGDGIDDLIVGARGGGGELQGEAYIVYGQGAATRNTLRLDSLTAPDGFAIQGDEPFDRLGFSVASAGDVNGDGVDDLIVGGDVTNAGGRYSGAAYVVYGKLGATRGKLDLTEFDSGQGFVIPGNAEFERVGFSVAPAGDVNGDGLADVIVGALGAGDAGEAYVVFGFDAPLSAIVDTAAAANRVAESARVGTRVGVTVQSIDPDVRATVSYSLTDDADGRFAINARTGAVTVAAPLDFETARRHQITVQATSTGGETQTATLTIAIINVDEPLGPVTDAASLVNRVAESAAPGARTGLIARAIDPDRADSVTYGLTDSAGGRFAINATTGVVTVAGPLDFETARSHQITVQATSSGGGTQVASFAIAVTNADDPLAPLTDIAVLPDRVAENAAIGTRVGLTARATDPDRADRVTYALTDSAGGRFAIDTATGVVTVAGALDFESAASHQITVQASSSGGDAQFATFTVAVIDVREFSIVPGTAVAETLLGTVGDDRFTPGAGSDTITGLGGNDVFVFATETRNGTSERDTITDFTPGDRLVLGPAQIFRELQVNGDTVLILDGDRDQIRLLGLSDFDPATMLV